MPDVTPARPLAALITALAIMVGMYPASAESPLPVAPPTPVMPAPPVVGGWSELRPDNAELIAAARYAVPRLGRPRARLRRIEGGEQQVVAGMNYRMVLQLADRSRWRAQVWRKLDGSYALTRSERIR